MEFWQNLLIFDAKSCNADCEVCKLERLFQCEDEKRRAIFRGSDEVCRLTPPELKVADSFINGAGLGVIATADIPEHIIIGDYEGYLVLEDDERATDNMYLYRTDIPYCYIDGSDPKFSNFTRFINHHKEAKRNVEALFHCPFGIPTITVVTCRKICKGEELYLDYGVEYNDYLRKLGFTNSTDKSIKFYF